MASTERPNLRPLPKIVFASDSRPQSKDSGVLPVPPPIQARIVAPDRRNPTEGNGNDSPRGELFIALVAPDGGTADVWRRQARVVTPPLWKGGQVHLHVIVQSKDKPIDAQVAQAMVDLGLVTSSDAGLIGYPE